MLIKLNELSANFTFWKIYAWLLLCISIVSYFSDDRAHLPTVLSVFSLLIGIAGIWAVFAYAYKKAFLHHLIWKTTFVIGIAWDLLYNIRYEDWSFMNEFSVTVAILSTVTAVLLIAPSYIVHFLYAYRSAKIWNKIQSNQHMDFSVKSPVD